MPTVITDAARLTMLTSISGDDVKAALMGVAVAGMPDWMLVTKSTWASLSAYEASGTGYTPGGASLSGVSVYNSSIISYYDGNSITWNNITISAYGVAIYRETADLVIAIIQFPADTSVDPPTTYRTAVNGPFSVAWSDSHILKVLGF
jgi:hypothetical protein